MTVDHSKPEIDALVALYKRLGYEVTDPKYRDPPQRARYENELRAAVRDVYVDHGHHLPRWIKAYIQRWRHETPRREPGEVSEHTQVLAVADADVPERESGGN